MTANWLKDLNLKPRSNSVKTFKSYVDLDPDVPDSVASESPPHLKKEIKNEVDTSTNETKPTPLLPGEVIIAQAENVLKFNTLSELNKGVSGLLSCTNFKISFSTAENFRSNLVSLVNEANPGCRFSSPNLAIKFQNSNDMGFPLGYKKNLQIPLQPGFVSFTHQRNAFLGEHDICLTNVDVVYHVQSGKRKKLLVTSSSASVEIIEIHCKDFRIYTFSFKFSPPHQRSVINTIIHHAFVPRIDLLFAFDCKLESHFTEESENHSILFTRPCDWEAELDRCSCPGWRVTLANEKFLLCESLPESFVVPSILLDMNLNKTAPHFSGHRVPIWSWGMSSGASIIRMAALDVGISDSKQKDVMVDAISRASSRQVPVHVFNLDAICPSYKELQSSFLKLRELCMPSTPQEFWQTDNNYLSNLESSKWLQHVSSCLNTALEAANLLLENTTVILQENEGRDLCAIVSSLIQIMLDPLYRTTCGFELLIQKEWVALGHPFTERHRLISGCESEESPVFLLFLDCVWQLSEQCPAVFEFSETYLTTLWDSSRISLFDTFLFSSHKSRTEAIISHSDHGFCLRSVWRWPRQFSRNDIRLFTNPLFILNKYSASAPEPSPKKGRPKSFSCLKDTAQSQSRPLVIKKTTVKPVVWKDEEENLLKIDPFLKSLKLWHQCYLRWIPLAHVLGGGPPVLFLTNLKICAEIQALERKIKSLSAQTTQVKPPSRHRRVASDDYTLSTDVIDFGQIQEGTSIVTSVFPFAPVAPWDSTSYHFVPSTSCLQISYSEVEEGYED